MYFVSVHGTENVDDNANLSDAMKALGPWSNRLGNTWLVECPFSASRIRDLLKAQIQPGERLFVGEMVTNWAGTNMGAQFPEWLNRRETMRQGTAPTKEG